MQTCKTKNKKIQTCKTKNKMLNKSIILKQTTNLKKKYKKKECPPMKTIMKPLTTNQ